MASVGVVDVRKSYGAQEIIHGVSIDIADGEFVILVGPSGCGKSTLLRMIAGLEPITSGDIKIGERVVNFLPPKDRDIAMVFQTYALYPHKTVAQNMGFALMLRRAPRAEIDARVKRAAEILDLVPYLDRYPRQLSGGQRQRVPLSVIPRYFYLTNRSPISTPNSGCKCALKSRNCINGSRRRPST
jgi:multiple sugar transport system ATP-binding protein